MHRQRSARFRLKGWSGASRDENNAESFSLQRRLAALKAIQPTR
ncbi:MAG: hypothetical protein QXT37_11590 [Thermofilaceae archaeon]